MEQKFAGAVADSAIAVSVAVAETFVADLASVGVVVAVFVAADVANLTAGADFAVVASVVADWLIAVAVAGAFGAVDATWAATLVASATTSVADWLATGC